MTPELISSLSLASPELIIIVGALALLMVGVFSGRRANDIVNGLAVAVLAGAGAWMLLFAGQGKAFGGAFVSDPFAVNGPHVTGRGGVSHDEVTRRRIAGLVSNGAEHVPESVERHAAALELEVCQQPVEVPANEVDAGIPVAGVVATVHLQPAAPPVIQKAQPGVRLVFRSGPVVECVA